MNNTLNLRTCPNCKGETALTLYIPPKGTKLVEAVCKNCNLKIDYKSNLYNRSGNSIVSYNLLLDGITEAVNGWIAEEKGGGLLG